MIDKGTTDGVLPLTELNDQARMIDLRPVSFNTLGNCGTALFQVNTQQACHGSGQHTHVGARIHEEVKRFESRGSQNINWNDRFRDSAGAGTEWT